jgi:hypothetical protein
MVIVAIDHLKKAKLMGPARSMAYLEMIKLPDHIIQAIMARTAPI